MATYDDVPIDPTDILDVPFERTSSKRVLKYYTPHKKASRLVSGGKKSAASGASSSVASPYGFEASHRVTRTGGVTGLLTTSQQIVPPSPKPHAPVRPQISAPAKGEVMQTKKPLPSDEVLNALFTRLMERMKLSPERVVELNSRTAEQKWSLILAQHEVQAGIACVFYIEQLVRHAQPELKEKRPRKKLLENLQPLSKILSDLEVDLRTNPNDSWVHEFVSTPNHGHVALIDLIKDLADNPFSVPRKNPKKYTVLVREPGFLNTSLLCLKALMSHKKGFRAVLNYDPSLCVLAYCLSNESIRVKILILNLLLTVLLAPGGHRKVLQAFDYSRAIMKERTRFQMLIESLMNEPVEPAYQAAALRFINTVVQTAQGPNAKVFHQHEFKEAGFSPAGIEKTLHGRQDERVLHELKEWHNNFISVQEYMDELALVKGKARNLKEDLDQFKKHLYEANLDREHLYEQIKKWISKYDRLRDENDRNARTISELLDAKLERDELLEENIQLLDANKRYHTHASELKQKIHSLLEENVTLHGKEHEISSLKTQIDNLYKFQIMAESTSQTSESLLQLPSTGAENTSTTSVGAGTSEEQPAPVIPAPPPLPPIIGSDPTTIPPLLPIGAPPVPPLPPIGGRGVAGVPIKKPIIPNVPLPMLNWIPIRNPDHTIFKELNDESVIETVDFSEFEALFQVKRFKKKEKSTNKDDETDQAKPAERLCLIEDRRARNLVIAKRRIGHSAVAISDSILQTDLDGLIAEHCELLLKFIPTQEELTELAKHSHKFASFGESEKFMYQLAKIDRYESRLNCMAYLGNFDELYSATQPRIDAVLQASLSVFRSGRLKKVFEIILAFGNYMNSSRRGAVYGFKLESLSKLMDTKSLDRKQTLLHYITHVVESVYPHVLSFYEDLDIEEASKVSNQILNEDVALLKNGLDDIKSEREKEPNNFILFSFYKQVSKKVLRLSESFTKMEDAYREVCLMFSESPKTMDPSDFFGMFATFINEWKKAVQSNHDSKRRHKAKAGDLLKKQDEETMADIASEAAAEAAVRAKRIFEETQKLSEKLKERSEDESKTGEKGEVIQDLEAEQKLKDIRKRSVHHINLQERLPWLKDSEVKIGDDLELPQRMTSPDSGVMDTLSEMTDPSENMSPLHATLTPTSSGVQNDYTDLIHVQNGKGTHNDDDLEIPPRDYPILLPPKDYPVMESSANGFGKPPTKTTQNDLFGGDDYYSMMTDGVVD